MPFVTVSTSCKRILIVLRRRFKNFSAVNYIVGYIALFILIIFIYFQTLTSDSESDSSVQSLPSVVTSSTFQSLPLVSPRGKANDDNATGHRNSDDDEVGNSGRRNDEPNEVEDDPQEFFRIQQERSDKNAKAIKRYFTFYNLLGKRGSNVQLLESLLEKEDADFRTLIWSRSANARKIAEKFTTSRNLSSTTKMIDPSSNPRTPINVATVSCGKSSVDVMVMLKSVVMFSQDADLHVIVFGDKTLPLVAEAILELKWTVNTLGWDFTYELAEAWFPQEMNQEWKTMYTLCSTQRLFLPSLLPHVDAVIYLDADSILISNITTLWMHFQLLNETQVAGIAPNTEFPADGYYNLYASIPYHGKRGINAGILIMNLTRARNFDLENRAIATYRLYREKIKMADQDILNILFHAHPERLYSLSCTWNFMWAHCGGHLQDENDDERVCIFEKQPGPICFCHEALKTGVLIVHGNSGTFYKDDYPLFRNIFRIFLKFKLGRDSFSSLYNKLKDDFDSLQLPCFYLTGEKLYKNMLTYFENRQLL